MLNCAILGYGNRGSIYADLLYKTEGVKITAVCDVNPENLGIAKQKYGLEDKDCFSSDEEFFKAKRGDCVVIATMDRLHVRQKDSRVPRSSLHRVFQKNKRTFNPRRDRRRGIGKRGGRRTFRTLLVEFFARQLAQRRKFEFGYPAKVLPRLRYHILAYRQKLRKGFVYG